VSLLDWSSTAVVVSCEELLYIHYLFFMICHVSDSCIMLLSEDL